MTEQDTKPTRRWYQFRLRTLLIMMTLCVLPLAWVSSEHRRRLREKEIVAWVNDMGGITSLSNGPLEESWLAHRAYEWFGGTVYAVDFEKWDGFGFFLTEEQRRPLQEKADRFIAAGSNIGPLAKLRDLTHLDLTGTDVSDLTPLAGSQNLKFLALDNTPVSDLSPLADLQKLEQLFLFDAPVSDISPLAKLGNLYTLSLALTKVTDFTPLAEMENLTTLYLVESQKTEELVKWLSEVKPRCKITLLGGPEWEEETATTPAEPVAPDDDE